MRRPACQNPHVPKSAPTPADASAGAPSPVRYRVFSAAGNRFALLDTHPPEVSGRARLARLLCGARSARLAFDGVLFVEPPSEGGDCRMVLHNADGSRAEACGNGLRCVALSARLTGLVTGARVRVETDRGLRAVELTLPAGLTAWARAAMGAGRVVERRAEFALEDGPLWATLVDMGNPHCVVEVPDIAAVDLPRIGAALEFHSRFPAGTNVEFAMRVGAGLSMRVWERGVGETGACGTGACAVALALAGEQATEFEVEVASPGGTLTVERDAGGELWLTGPCEALELVEYQEARQ